MKNILSSRKMSCFSRDEVLKLIESLEDDSFVRAVNFNFEIKKRKTRVLKKISPVILDRFINIYKFRFRGGTP